MTICFFDIVMLFGLSGQLKLENMTILVTSPSVDIKKKKEKYKYIEGTEISSLSSYRHFAFVKP